MNIYKFLSVVAAAAAKELDRMAEGEAYSWPVNKGAPKAATADGETVIEPSAAPKTVVAGSETKRYFPRLGYAVTRAGWEHETARLQRMGMDLGPWEDGTLQ